MDTPRLRMFAGPDGSGKSTIKSVLPPAMLGVYLNPDEMEKEIFDARLAFTLLHHGVTRLATANRKHFNRFGFAEVWDPVAG